jgi:hypothetical protein
MSPTLELKETAAEICKRFEPGEKARALLQPKSSPLEFLRLLESKQLYTDGIRFAAYALPCRGAIWWGCLCVWSIHRPAPPEKIAAALSRVVAWIQEPDEENRRAAENVIEVAGKSSPAGGLAAAIFLSGDNIAPVGQPEVKPKAFLWSKVLAGTVVSAAKRVSPEKVKESERQFVALAIGVAEMGIHWDPRTAEGEVIVRTGRGDRKNPDTGSRSRESARSRFT